MSDNEKVDIYTTQTFKSGDREMKVVHNCYGIHIETEFYPVMFRTQEDLADLITVLQGYKPMLPKQAELPENLPLPDVPQEGEC